MRKHAEAEARVKRVTPNLGRVFHFKPEKLNNFEYCNNLWKQNIFPIKPSAETESMSIKKFACGVWYVYANLRLHVKLRDGINQL